MDDSDEMREFEHLLENFDIESFMEKFEPSMYKVEDVRPETTFAVDKISVEAVSNTDEGEVQVLPIEIVPPLELKPLPNHLRYAFLGPNDTLPVIISTDLSRD